MDHYTFDRFGEAAAKHLAPKYHDSAKATNRLSGIYIREDGSFFSTSMHPKSVSARKKVSVVAVVHPEKGWCG